ncbi:MAG: class I SAM-dependent methyltransferase [Acidobacteriota bacterium]
MCGVCGSREAMEVQSFASYPAYLVPLPLDLAAQVPRAPLELVSCLVCGHFQVPFVDAEVQRLVYEVYYKHYQVDTMESMVPAYRDPFQRVVEGAGLRKGRLLEIGCSSGAMIPFLSRFCTEYTGVDPSERIEIALARHPEHRFVRSYFPPDQPVGTFDVAVTQFNLEHIQNVGVFVAALAAAVRVDGTLFVQVPDAGYFLRTAQPNFLAHEHVHYFRRAQLTALLRAHGFEPETWGDEGASLICAARRVDRVGVDSVVTDPLADAATLRALDVNVPELPPGAVLYGVGLTLHWLLARSPSIGTGAVVVDDHPGYHGKGVPGYELPIEKPSPALLAGRDVVLTLNAIYHDRVLARLRTMGPIGRVHRIADGGWTTCSL